MRLLIKLFGDLEMVKVKNPKIKLNTYKQSEGWNRSVEGTGEMYYILNKQ